MSFFARAGAAASVVLLASGCASPERPNESRTAAQAGFIRARVEARLGSHQPRKVRFDIDVPDGWTATPGAATTRFSADGGRGVLEVGLSCQGPCGGPQTLGQNLRRARDLVAGGGHASATAMLAPLAEESPGRFYTRWRTTTERGAVDHVAIDRLLEGMDTILTCTAEVPADAPIDADAIERACRSIALLRS